MMCLAEALLRIPDAHTADELIADKLAGPDWSEKLGRSDSAFVNAATFSLLLTGKVLEGRAGSLGQLEGGARPRRRPARRAGRPHRGARGDEDPRPQFRVRPHDRRSAEARRSPNARRGLSHSFDMLGEAAKTFARRRALRRFLSQCARPHREGSEGRLPQVARHFGQADRASPALRIYPSRTRRSRAVVPVVRELALKASKADVHFTIDAEEADRLELQLDVFEALLADDELFANGWGGFGIAIQAYQKRAAPLCDWVVEAARAHGRKLMVPAGQGRLLGHRDQGRAGRRPARLSGLHAQGRDRRLLSRLREEAARGRATSSTRPSRRTTPTRSAR